MKAWLWPALLAITIATSAHATGVEDGAAGLDALNRGAYDEAIRLFTRALQPGRLTPGDREFAFLNRGAAYTAKGDYVHAIADLKEAVRLKPDDDDAQNSLQAALAKQAGDTDEEAAAPPPGQAGGSNDSWGLLSAMAGHYYWYQLAGKDPQEAYVRVAWVTPQTALSLSVNNKSDQLLICEYKIDAKTGEIIFAAVASDKAEYGTVSATKNGNLVYGYVNGAPTRDIIRPQADGSIRDTSQVYTNSTWKDAGSVVLVEATVDELTAQGLIKAKKH